MTRLSALWGALWRAIPRRAVWVLLVLALPTAASLAALFDPATGGLRLHVDASADRLLPEDAPERAFYDRTLRLFGSDKALVVVIGAPDVFAAGTLARLVELTRRLEDQPEVASVLSLANAPDVRAVEDDVVVEAFLAEIPGDSAGLAALRASVLGSPLYGGSLVARDGRATALVVRLRGLSDDAVMRGEVDRRILAEAERAFAGEPGAEVWLTGGPHIQAEGARVLLAESLTLPLASLAFLAAVLVLAFRTGRGVALPLLAICLGVLWTLGLAAALGHALNAVTVLVPPLLITLGLSYTVHVVSEYYEEVRAHAGGGGRAELVGEALQRTALPLVTCGITTAVGFGSLCLSPLGAVRDFGWLAVSGTVFTLVASLSFVPAVLALLPAPRRLPPVSGSGGLSVALGRACSAIARFDVDRRQLIFAVALAVLAVSLFGATRMKVGTQQIEKFSADAPVRVHFEAVNRRFGGVNPLTIVLETERTEGFKEPATLKAVKDLQDWLEAQPEIGGTTSLVDYLEVAHRAFAGGEAAGLAIPASRGLVSQILFAAGSDELERFVDGPFESAAVHVRAKVIDSAEVAALTARIEARLAELPEPLRGAVTGSSVVFNKALDEIIRGQALSLVTGLGIIYVILAVMFLSARIGLVALVPNVLPIAFYFGLLGWTGITLSPGTSLVAPIVLGIAVDDTIHYFARFMDDARRLGSERQATESALRAIGPPVTTTALALCGGFLVLNLSAFETQGELGSLAAATLAFGWVCDLTLTPALCSRLRIVTLWELLTLDLGSEPQRTIGLFRGLSAAQARIVALMGALVPVRGGERLWRAGEPADALYVVIDGKLRASVEREGGVRELAVHGRGDVLGEVGLAQHARSADVDALEDGRLLRLSQAHFDQLARRYPRIAAAVLRNLNEVLAQRLARLTDRFGNEAGRG
jgi:hydrophobe/amphiphile efflux-3 (HAE3) family protein